jgi:hypothetical protein
MKKEVTERKKLLMGESHLEAYAKKFYIDRFSNVINGWRWESKVRWGLPSEPS